MTHYKQFNDFRIQWVTTVLNSLEETVLSFSDFGDADGDGFFPIEQSEAILGISFVVAQIYILGITEDLNDVRISSGKNTLSKIEYYKDYNLQRDKIVSPIEIINSIANYFKHHDEWGDEWPKNYTAENLAFVGINEKTDFPCNRIAEKLLGESNSWNVGLLLPIITSWRKVMFTKYC